MGISITCFDDVVFKLALAMVYEAQIECFCADQEMQWFLSPESVEKGYGICPSS